MFVPTSGLSVMSFSISNKSFLDTIYLFYSELFFCKTIFSLVHFINSLNKVFIAKQLISVYLFKEAISFMLYGGINLNSTVCLYFVHRSKKFHCFAGVSMALTLFCSLTHLNKINVTFIKLGIKDINMMMSWRYFFPPYNVFGCFSLKETENVLNICILYKNN